MNKIAILTDSCCDLPKETIKELGINVLPFTLTIGGESFREIYDKSTKEFYELLETTDEIPKHSQISPITFEETYKELFEKGYTDIISVSINSKGSGTFNNSVLAKNDFYENNPEAEGKMRIYNIDSKCYTLFYGYPVMEAAKKIRRGAEPEEIVAYLEDWFNVSAIYAVPFTLKYAKKSGRISAAKAFAGELLGLKPVIMFADGNTETVDKIRGEKNIVSKLVEIVEKNMTPQTPYIMLHGKDDTVAKEVEKELAKKTGRKAEMFGSIGAVVTANIGPDLVAVVVRRKNIIERTPFEKGASLKLSP
ncbi:DegV family protein [Ruminococcus flavefaciens]|uniref:DegV family protein n=1 Tax=Ruminococcus flavefaciens TaxID=1265 RepID=UPI0013DCDB10|nr:DegV family protein [Ruminococcus flavefaciens]